MSGVSSPSRILLVAMSLGVCVDILFWGSDLGISVPLFAILCVGALLWLGRLEEVPPARHNLWLAILLIFFAGMVFVRANEFLTFLNLATCLLLLTLVACFYGGGRVALLRPFGYMQAVLLTWANSIVQAAPLLHTMAGKHPGRVGRFRKLVPVLRGLVLALPVLLVFTCLLASADMIFSRLLVNLLTGFALDINDISWRVSIVLVAAWVIAGGLAFALSRRGGRTSWDEKADEVTSRLSIGFIESVTVLVLVDLLFLAFGAIQVAYLFGGEANITAQGFTYADYARRGFFELLAVSILTLGLILGLYSFTWRETGRQRLLFNLAGSTMVGLTLVLLASAFLRMSLYQEAYGYTHLRLYVHIFEIWLGLTFLWALVVIWTGSKRFALGAFLAALGFVASLNLVNPDATIARENLDHYARTGDLDMAYLTGLSEDAIPALLQGIGSLPHDRQVELGGRLRQQMANLETSPRQQNWPAFHLARWTAYEALASQQVTLADLGAR